MLRVFCFVKCFLCCFHLLRNLGRFIPDCRKTFKLLCVTLFTFITFTTFSPTRKSFQP